MTTYGRTVGKFSKFQISDSTTTLRDIPVNSFGSVGLTYAEVDVTALQDAITSVFNGQGSMGITISGPFDTTAVVGASTTGQRPILSGSHPVLSGLNGGTVAKTFGVYLGSNQGDWASGDPVFGAAKSIIVTDYTVDPAAGTYSAKIAVAGNRSGDPSWGTAQLAAATT